MEKKQSFQVRVTAEHVAEVFASLKIDPGLNKAQKLLGKVGVPLPQGAKPDVGGSILVREERRAVRG